MPKLGSSCLPLTAVYLGLVAACTTAPSSGSTLTVNFSGTGPYADSGDLLVDVVAESGLDTTLTVRTLDQSAIDVPEQGRLELTVRIRTGVGRSELLWSREVALGLRLQYGLAVTVSATGAPRGVCYDPDYAAFLRAGPGSPVDTAGILFDVARSPIPRPRPIPPLPRPPC